MWIKGHIATTVPTVPIQIRDRITCCATCELSDLEFHVFANAFHAIAMTIEQNDDISNSEASISIIFTDQDNIGLSIENEDVLGQHVSIALYPLHKWRNMHLNYFQMLGIALEELCHYFFRIKNENLIRDIVLQSMRYIHPTVQLSDVYNPYWTQDEETTE